MPSIQNVSEYKCTSLSPACCSTAWPEGKTTLKSAKSWAQKAPIHCFKWWSQGTGELWQHIIALFISGNYCSALKENGNQCVKMRKSTLTPWYSSANLSACPAFQGKNKGTEGDQTSELGERWASSPTELLQRLLSGRGAQFQKPRCFLFPRR